MDLLELASNHASNSKVDPTPIINSIQNKQYTKIQQSSNNKWNGISKGKGRRNYYKSNNYKPMCKVYRKLGHVAIIC